MAIQIPVVNAGNLYVNNLQVTRASATTLSMAAGHARDSTNVSSMELDSAVTLNAAVVGANGIDTGSLTTNAWYAIYIIGDSSQLRDVAGLISLASNSEPTLPYGYDMYQRVDYKLTDGSSEFLIDYSYGNDTHHYKYFDATISELSGGNDTSFTAIDLASSVPPIATQVIFDVLYTPTGATDVAEFLPFASSASTGIVRFGTGVAAAQVGQIMVPCSLDSGVPKIKYKVTSGDTLTLKTAGYIDYLL